MQIQYKYPTFCSFQQKSNYQSSFQSKANTNKDIFVKSMPAFKGDIITSLSGTGSLNGTEIKKEEIPERVKEFTNSLILGAKSNKLTLADINMLMMVHATGIPIEVKDIKTVEGVDENAIAFCFPSHDSEGNLKKTYLFINFDKPVSQTSKTLAHEFTHCLQFNTKEAKAMMKELIPADNNTNNYFNVYRSFERHLQDNNIHKRVDENVITIGTMLATLTGKLPEPLNVFNFNHPKLQKEYDIALNNALEEFKIEDKNLALRFIKFRLGLEVEAYKNGANAIKQYIKFPEEQPIPNDLISKMYSDCVQYIDTKIKKI